MNKYLLIITLLFATYGIDTWACRPNINRIQHNLTMASITAVYDKEGLSVLNLQEKSLTNFQMDFVLNDPDRGCPDKFMATLNLTYQTNKIRKSFIVDIVTEYGYKDTINIKQISQ